MKLLALDIFFTVQKWIYLRGKNMRTKLEKTFIHGFVLTESDLQSIYYKLEEQMKQIVRDGAYTVKFDVELKNGMILQTSNIDEIFSESNGGNKEIRSLKIELISNNQTDPARVYLEFNKRDYFFSNLIPYALMAIEPVIEVASYHSISYSISANERNWVYLTSSEVEDRIARIKQFPIRLIGEVIIYILLPIILVMTIITWLLYKLSIGDIVLIISIICLLILGGVSCIYGFPLYNFLWEDYIKTFHSHRSIGKGFLILVMLGLIITVIGGIIANYLTIRIGVGH